MTNNTIAQQIKDLFHFKEGNWVAKEQGTIGDIKIPMGFYLSIITQWLGGYWVGDNCIFDDDSMISFEDANTFAVGMRLGGENQ